MWLLRKDPGLRLRLDGELDPGLVRPGLERLRSAGLIAGWFMSVYEPEIHQFGGPAAMDAVHAYFDADTRALLIASQAAGRRVTNTVLSLAILNDLFERSLGAREEVWDVWCNLQAMYRGHGRPGAAIPALTLERLAAVAGPAELELVALYEAANRRLAAALDAAWRAGALQCGRRSILPFVAAFHWNRHGFELERMTTLADAMAAAWSPKRGLRGAAAEARPV